MKKNAIIGQSGGPTAVINASLYGIIKEGKARREFGQIYGMIHGIEGFLSGNYTDLESLTEEDLELLKLTPAAYLGSCRYKLPDDLSSPFYPALFEKFRALNIGYFFYIGGNDSMDTVSKLSRFAAGQGEGLRFIGIPKTIDNDLILTDHTPGYGSAAKYVADTVGEIALDSSVYQQKSVTIIELMGRHAGWLTAAGALARKYQGDNPLLLYLPETPFDLQKFSSDLEAALHKNNTVVLCVSEGISDSHGKFLCEYMEETPLDTFGHKMLTGSGKILESFVRRQFGVKVRSIELNVSQRCCGRSLSAIDLEESVQAGKAGVKAALEGATGKMIAFRRLSGSPYSMECVTVSVEQVCNQEKLFPKEWICSNGTDVSREFLDYALPFIQGEVRRSVQDGRPVYLHRK